MLFADEVVVQRRRTDVGEHTARRVDRGAVGERDRDRAAVAHHDAGDWRRATHRAPGGLESADQRSGEIAGATFGHGIPVLLAGAREQPAEEPAGRRVGADVAVQGVAGEQQASALTDEALLGEPPHRQQGLAREVEEPAWSEREGELGRAPHGRDG